MSAAPQIDWSKYDTPSSAPASQGAAPQIDFSKYEGASNTDQPSGLSDFASALWKQVSPVAGIKGAAQIAAHPIDSIKNDAETRQNIYSNAENEFQNGNYARGAAHLLYAALPFIGPQLDAAGNDFAEGRAARGAGTSVGLGLGLAAPGAIAEAGVIPKTMAAASDIASGGWRKIGNPAGLASTGEELLTQGISPRTSMTNFKSSLSRVTGDLKAYDAQSKIGSVQDLSDAIPEIKQKIWSDEVQPALDRQSTRSVNMKPVADAVRGQISDEMKTFDEGNADKLESLASKLENARDVGSAGKLLKYINGNLESYFQKFPAARKANLMNNPETAGWEAARAELRNQFLGTLEDAGESGVRDARLRYGALDTLQDAVERRVNVADRAKPMDLGRIVGLAGAGLSGATPLGGASIAAGELSHYLNKPDVLVRRGIGALESPQGNPTPFGEQPSAVSPLTGATLASPQQLFRKAGNE
jgi:hypothetical protein